MYTTAPKGIRRAVKKTSESGSNLVGRLSAVVDARAQSAVPRQ